MESEIVAPPRAQLTPVMRSATRLPLASVRASSPGFIAELGEAAARSPRVCRIAFI
jgi:hypothetical protein